MRPKQIQNKLRYNNKLLFLDSVRRLFLFVLLFIDIDFAYEQLTRYEPARLARSPNCAASFARFTFLPLYSATVPLEVAAGPRAIEELAP